MRSTATQFESEAAVQARPRSFGAKQRDALRQAVAAAAGVPKIKVQIVFTEEVREQQLVNLHCQICKSRRSPQDLLNMALMKYAAWRPQPMLVCNSRLLMFWVDTVYQVLNDRSQDTDNELRDCCLSCSIYAN